jgi:5-methylcytosine-specific restriction protein A
MSFNRDKDRDRRKTREAMAGGSRVDETDKERNWLGHSLASGAARIDEMLLTGAPQEELERARGAVDEHLNHLRTEHGLCVAEENGKLVFDIPAVADDFRNALRSLLGGAERLGLSYIGITAGALHRCVGGYPGPNHRMPVCCAAMREAMTPSDRIVEQPPSGDGASLLMHYSLPRQDGGA